MECDTCGETGVDLRQCPNCYMNFCSRCVEAHECHFEDSLADATGYSEEYEG